MLNWLRTIRDWMILLACCYYCWPMTKFSLHMFQQNRYELRRYFQWQSTYFFRLTNKLVIGLLVTLGLWLVDWVMPAQWYWLQQLIMVAGLLLIGWLWDTYQDQQPSIKPLVFTPRIYRECGIMLVLVGMLYSVIMLGPLPWQVLIGLLAPLTIWLIYPMALVGYPIERWIQNRFKQEAIDILNRQDLMIIGITGSYGKTSTKNIIKEVVSHKYLTLMTPASYNTPMGITRTIRELLKPIHQVLVCEMGADKVNEIRDLMQFVRPQYGIVTSIGPQHLQTFGSLENIIKEKMQMIEMLPANGVGFINYDNEYIRNYPVKNNCQLVTYGLEYRAVDYFGSQLQYHPQGASFTVETKYGEQVQFTTKLLGQHNLANVLCAIAVGRQMGIEWSQLQQAVANVHQIEHRLEVKPYLKYTMIDDSFNSNPSGSKMALEVLSMMPGQRIVITCGMVELAEQQEALNRKFGELMVGKVDLVMLVGHQQTKPIYEGLISQGFMPDKIIICDTTKQAMLMLPQVAQPGDTFLVENDLPDAFNR